ncbi:DUF654-domain-containing protein [Westerdykella ornata]|uniref:DUF654-domain-containing protein n=1 Tax=Westerdykella ornata TaxID=318751 RepID=A0A6A6JPH4_WESOR|nr:DUF654-domain-containing protein [Westerdykella ornata]KAF2278043.1 DUF654-domain-containing protein [Westerdykella ornata]
MSTRALRRAQKELEERQRLENMGPPAGEDEDDTDEQDHPVARTKTSLFAVLQDVDDTDQDGEDETEGGQDDSSMAVRPEEAAVIDETRGPKSKKSKKKKKRKSKTEPTTRDAQTASSLAQKQVKMDEIDRALLALNMSTQCNTPDRQDAEEYTSCEQEELRHLYSALAINTQHLHAANEMRKLFGRAAQQSVPEDLPPAARRRQRGRGHQGPVQGGRHPSLGLRKNIFIQGKDEWPRAAPSGLSMELVEKRRDGTVEYRFVHSRSYQDVQRQFETCVASMDPARMLQLLHFNPYHISTLLQVSEIAKQQRDNASAGDLIERALFSFGRAVHSTFSNNLSQGKARLDFRRPENREFWLAGWRYITILGIRATWRTAFEWAKLLLSLAPEEDPYCVRLVIDQLALRGREPEALVNLATSDHLQREWKIPPNLAFSVALAYDRLGSPEKSRSSLALAISEYPWIAARLIKELDITPIPKSVWGKEPNDTFQELLCQLYVPKAKDLWNTPEATSLLMEVVSSFERPLDAGENPYWQGKFNEDNLARHVILSDDRTLLSFLDQRVKSRYTSVSDPLPPSDSILSYQVPDPGEGGERTRSSNVSQLMVEMEQLRAYFERVDMSEFSPDLTREDMSRLLSQSGTSIEEFSRNAQRFQNIQHTLTFRVDADLQNLGVAEDSSSGTDQ